MEKEWDKTCDRFVAFFDIMGFKDMVQRSDHNEVLQQLIALKGMLKQLEGYSAENHDELKKINVSKNQVRSVTFSDSILLFSRSNELPDLQKIVLDSYTILGNSIQKK
ncbi:hypothetical protein [Asinibacterium sp. OR53]|uniref:hypothetical protein n=1 Tax=Asinibacterium sp. OR53 TaxID=925409 RepID=UPI00047CC048|nr:hypothetical protein [Asinibacterium sp. OR53]